MLHPQITVAVAHAPRTQPPAQQRRTLRQEAFHVIPDSRVILNGERLPDVGAHLVEVFAPVRCDGLHVAIAGTSAADRMRGMEAGDALGDLGSSAGFAAFARTSAASVASSGSRRITTA